MAPEGGIGVERKKQRGCVGWGELKTLQPAAPASGRGSVSLAAPRRLQAEIADRNAANLPAVNLHGDLL